MNRRSFLSILPLLPLAFTGSVLADEPKTPETAAMLASDADHRSLHGLQIKDHVGENVPLAVHSGRLLIINLWGPWCVPCRREMPSLSRLHDRLADLPATMLPVAFDRRGVDGVRQFYEANKISNLPILTGDGENLQSVTGKSHLPLTLIADKQGNWISSVEGEAIWDDTRTLAWIERLAMV